MGQEPFKSPFLRSIPIYICTECFRLHESEVNKRVNKRVSRSEQESGLHLTLYHCVRGWNSAAGDDRPMPQSSCCYTDVCNIVHTHDRIYHAIYVGGA